jgi:periplasmic protein TonB
MTRLQKKCFFVSAGMHGLLLLILLGSSAFRSRPVAKDITLPMTMVNIPITDEQGVGGGSPGPAATAPPAPQPAASVVSTPQAVAPTHAAQSLQHPLPQVVERKPEPQPEPRPEPQPEKEAESKPARKTHDHEIHPSFEPVKPVSHDKTKPKATEAEAADSSSSAEAKRRQRQIDKALHAFASDVKTSGADGTVVNMPGQGGGEAFVGYETVIYNVYYHAWIAPDSVADKLAATDVKIVVARDGTILSAEIVNKSGEKALDRSVDEVLRKVIKLPPFPASAHDEQRTFKIRFNLESKEASG